MEDVSGEGDYAMTESDIKRTILLRLGARPDCLVWNHPTGVATLSTGHVIRYGLVGSPDIIGVCAGRAIGVEVKAARGRQSDQQKRFQAAWEARGGLYILAKSADEAEKGLQI